MLLKLAHNTDGWILQIILKFWLDSSIYPKLSSGEPPCSDIGMPESSPLRLDPLLLPLHPGPPPGCLPVLLPHPRHPVQQAGGVSFGSSHAESSPEPCQDDASLLVSAFPPPGQTLGTQL